jgi:hypothetical protein
MNQKEKKVAAELLRTASEQFSNHGCNDWNYPKDWTEDEKLQFVREYHEWNGDPEDFDPEFLFLQDWAVMSFLAHKLENS